MKFWGFSEQSAYVGWFVTLSGGVGIGVGCAMVFFARVFAQIIPTLNPNLMIDPEGYANLQLLGSIFIFMGLLGCIFGIMAIHHSQKTVTEKPVASVTMEKKFCRYCGTENKTDAVFCEKCGKKLVDD